MVQLKSKYVLYYVEGDDEKKLVDVLKNDLRVIKPGKVHKLNVVEKEITCMHLRPLNRATMVVLIFDTDTDSSSILKKNIKTLQDCSSVSEVVLIPQVRNLEDELVHSCSIKKAEDLLNSKSRTKFKSDFIHVSNLDKKLQDHGFDIDRLWCRKPSAAFQGIENQASRVKLSPVLNTQEK